MLAGVQRPDEGDVLVDGEVKAFHGPADARDAGVAVIYQEPTLFPDLSIAENVMMGRHPLGSGRRIDFKALHRTVKELLDRLGVKLDPEQPVKGLSIADQQIVEIAKALSFDARVLIMDEPTAALSGHEVERLFNVVRTLKERGAAVLFINHRLDEIFTICDTVTVLRDGEVTHDGRTADMDTDELVRAHGRPRAVEPLPEESTPRSASRSSRSTVSRARASSSTSRSRSSAARSSRWPASSARVTARSREPSSASTKPDAGTLTVDGATLKPGSPTGAMKAGIGLVPEDRRQQGLVMELSIERNMGLTRLQALRNKLGVIGDGLARPSSPPTGRASCTLKFHKLTRPSTSCRAATSRRWSSASGSPPARRS